MNEDSVELVIDSIANKLGIATERAIPEIIKYNITGCIINLIWAGICAAIVYISIKVILTVHDKHINDGDFDLDDMSYTEVLIVLTSAILFVIFVIVGLINLAGGLNILKWIISPEGATIAYVLKSLK